MVKLLHIEIISLNGCPFSKKAEYIANEKDIFFQVVHVEPGSIEHSKYNKTYPEHITYPKILISDRDETKRKAILGGCDNFEKIIKLMFVVDNSTPMELCKRFQKNLKKEMKTNPEKYSKIQLASAFIPIRINNN